MKNLKLSLKLILGFMIILFMAIVIGCVGMLGMRNINSADDELYNENLLAISAIGKIRENIQRQRVNTRHYVIYAGMEDKIAEFNKIISSYEKDIEILFADYEKTIVDEAAEKPYFDGKNVYYNDFARLKAEVERAAHIGFEETVNLLNDPDTIEIGNSIVEHFSAVAELNEIWAKNRVDNNTRLYITMLTIECVVLLVAGIFAVILSLYISGMISKPLGVFTAFMKKAGSTGDMTLTDNDKATIAEYTTIKDEIGTCISASAAFVMHIQEICDELRCLADGNLDVNVKLLSENDTMGAALNYVVDNLNKMFSDINSSTEQVFHGSKQLADGAQTLAQGATEQAAAIEQLSSSISQIAEKTKRNAEMAIKTASLADNIKKNAEKGNMQMSQMMEAVKEINEASQSISKVISVIDNIAFQTNILALNAAVEAARAGQHGKGFAVVAEEVRALAHKSADAAKDTGELIANSMEKAELGAQIAQETASSLSDIVNGINESGKLVADIAKSSEEQSLGITQIDNGIDQVAQVVQQNSATAEESASASEQINGQASMLSDMVKQFKLRNTGMGRYEKPSYSKTSLKMPPKPSAENTQSHYEAMNAGGYGKY